MRFRWGALLIAGLLTAAFSIGAGVARAQVQVKPDTTRMAPLPALPPAPGPALLVDFERNEARLTSARAVESLVDSAAACGFRRIIVGLKKRDGSVAFKTRRAPLIPLSFDYWGAFEKAATRRGIDVVAHLSLMVEGDTRTRTGPAYEHPEWQTWARSGSDSVIVRQGDHPSPGPVILANPGLPEVQQYESSVVSDLITGLKPKILLLDDIRFFHSDADLGDSTRVRFDRWIGLSPTEWPRQVVEMESARYGLWRTFRVGIVREYIGRLQALCAHLDPNLQLCLAVPGLYEVGINAGVNWAHPDFRPNIFYAKEDFRSKGLAPLFREYVVLNRDANPRAIQEVMTAVRIVTRNALPAAILLSPELFATKPGRFREALQTILGNGHGVVISDPNSLATLGFWEILKDEFSAAGPETGGK